MVLFFVAMMASLVAVVVVRLDDHLCQVPGNKFIIYINKTNILILNSLFKFNLKNLQVKTFFILDSSFVYLYAVSRI